MCVALAQCLHLRPHFTTEYLLGAGVQTEYFLDSGLGSSTLPCAQMADAFHLHLGMKELL